MMPAADATLIDSTGMTIDSVIERLVADIRVTSWSRRVGRHGPA